MTRHHPAAAAFAALAFVSSAFAYQVSPLPGSTPQRAAVNELFPNPIGVLVTDDEGRGVAGARITWLVPGSTGLRMETRPSSCFADLGTDVCSMLTDASGVARLPRFFLASNGVKELHATVTINSNAEGDAYFQLGAGSFTEPARIQPASGVSQAATIGTALPQPLRVRLSRPDGTPLVNQDVIFKVPGWYSQPRASFAGQLDANTFRAKTDGEGYAQSGVVSLGWGVGTGNINATFFDSASGVAVQAPFDFRVTNSQGGKSLRFQDMWWSGPQESGWGLTIAQHAGELFAIVFAYDANGRATWYAMSDGKWAGGIGNELNGFMFAPKGTPFYAYDASKLGGIFDTGRYGRTTLSFQGPDQGKLAFTMGVTRMEKNIARYDFSKDSASPVQGVGDLWWGGPAQSGWGVSIMEQPGGLFSVWFTYDENGEPTWFAMTDGQWTSANTYEGRMHQATSSGWFGVPYDATRFRATDVGPYKLRFLGANAAQLEYNVNGRTGTLDLSRTPFGDD
jgi:hypothetical protein